MQGGFGQESHSWSQIRMPCLAEPLSSTGQCQAPQCHLLNPVCTPTWPSPWHGIRHCPRRLVTLVVCRVQASDDDGKGLVEMVMDLLGIDPNSIGEDDNLAGMGIDSMQVVEVRARIQRALGRPIPLEEVSFDTEPCSSY